jgi:hypothetical protein
MTSGGQLYNSKGPRGLILGDDNDDDDNVLCNNRFVDAVHVTNVICHRCFVMQP